MIALAEIKDWLGVTVTDYDTLLTNLEERVVAFIERQTGRYFGPVETVEPLVLLGHGTRNLWLPERPRVGYDGDDAEADDLTVLERAYPAGTETVIVAAETTGFFLRKTETGAMLVRRPAGIRWEFYYEYEISVTDDGGWTRGYEAGEEPADIRQLVLDLIKLKWDARTRTAGVSGETIGGYSYTLGAVTDSDLDRIPMARSTLELWRGLRYSV